jgi:tetratricopeptide (TPR) repeat protein
MIRDDCMSVTRGMTAAIAGLSLIAGIGIGTAAKLQGTGIATIQGLAPREAGLAALAEAERLAKKSSFNLIEVGRVYYLSGDKEHGQLLFDRATSGKQDAGDYARIGRVYAQAGDLDKAAESFHTMLALDPKDDGVQAEAASWYFRSGDRAKGEELLAKVLQKHPNDVNPYVRAAEGLLQVPDGS